MPSNAQLLVLDKNQVESLLNPNDVMAAVREAFELHSQARGRVFPIVREQLSTGGVFGIKSGDVQSQSLLGFKAAGFWPSNSALGGEPHQATILLIDPSTGRPTCLIDGNAITTMRTGAAGGLGLQLLARQDSQTLCVFGTGVQARVQVDFALRLMPFIRKISYITVNDKRDDRFENIFSKNAEINHTTDRNATVAISDIVITATPGAGPLFDARAVQPGTHINCVGADTKGKRELPQGLLSRVHLFVDDRIQAQQIGENQWADDTPSIEIGDLLMGTTSFDRQASDITVFDMTGLALQDLTVARMLHLRAIEADKGLSISWPW
jgi:alanine dehydrogenase